MAGDWLKWCKGFARKPEIVSMADMLSTTRGQIATAFMEVCEWLDSEGMPDNPNNPDSDISIQLVSRSGRDGRALLVSHIDDVAHVAGMAEALENVGWIELKDGTIVFKRASRHNTETGKRRALASRRQKKHRSKTKQPARHAKIVTREEKRREEIKEATNVASSPQSAIATLLPPMADFSFPLSTGKLWDMPKRKHDEYIATYGEHLDVNRELRKARQWLMDNNARRPRSSRGIQKFLTSWLNRSTDSHAKTMPGSRVAAAPTGKEIYNAETGEIVLPLEG
jgi:hypothetical protein